MEGVSESKDRTLDPVDAPYRFLRVPGCAHFPVGVTSIEETTQADLAPVADPLMRSGEEPPYPIQRVILAASVSQGFVLDSSSYLVETLVGQADDVERVRYLHSVREHPVIRLPIRTGHDPTPPSGSRRATRGAGIGTTTLRYQPFYHRLCRTGWWPPTSTTEVHQTLVRHRPFRQNNDSCRCPQPRPRLSDRCRPPGVHRPNGQPRCSPHANHNPTPRRPRRPNGPAHPPRRSPTSPPAMSTTPVGDQSGSSEMSGESGICQGESESTRSDGGVLHNRVLISLNPPIHVPKTNPDQGDLRDPPLTGSYSSSQDRTILTNSYRRRSGGISTISPCPLRHPHRWIQDK